MSNLSGTLGLASRARKIAAGDQVIKSIQSRNAKLVLISDICGNNTKKKLIDKCTFYQIPYEYIEDGILNRSLGQSNRKSVAILDEGFAQTLIVCLKG